MYAQFLDAEDLQGRNEKHLLSYKESNEGPADALRWTVQCKGMWLGEWNGESLILCLVLVKGEVLGSGTDSQLRTAREQAAQSACHILGITP